MKQVFGKKGGGCEVLKDKRHFMASYLRESEWQEEQLQDVIGDLTERFQFGVKELDAGYTRTRKLQLKVWDIAGLHIEVNA